MSIHGLKSSAEGLLNAPKQAELFFESATDALGSCIQSCGGFKRVAAMLWPAMKAESAYARLKSCLDDSKHEKLSADEILAIAKEARAHGNHAWMDFCAAELGYAKPNPVEPEDARAELQRQFIDAVNRAESLAKRLQK